MEEMNRKNKELERLMLQDRALTEFLKEQSSSATGVDAVYCMDYISWRRRVSLQHWH